MKTTLVSAISLLLCLQAEGQYRKETQESQDKLVGTKQWISPPLPMQAGKIMYAENVKLEQQSRETLFNNALEWYNYNYKTADTRLSVEKPAEGKIAGTGVVKYTPAAAGVAGEVPIFFSFELDIKDGGYVYKVYDIYGVEPTGRFEYADMYREDRNPSTQVKPRWDKRYRYEMLSDMNTMIEMMLSHLIQTMARPG